MSDSFLKDSKKFNKNHKVMYFFWFLLILFGILTFLFFTGLFTIEEVPLQIN